MLSKTRKIIWALAIIAIILVVVCVVQGVSKALTPQWSFLKNRPNPSDITGTYELISSPRVIRIPPASKIVLRVDPAGKEEFHGENMPLWWTWAPHGEVVDVWKQTQGTWEIEAPPLGGWGILVKCGSTKPIDSGGFQLTVATDKDGVILLLGIVGDPDNKEFVVYKRIALK